MTLALLVVTSACGPNRSEPSPDEHVPRPTIQEVQEAHTPEWMQLPGVVGTGIGLCEGEPCIRIFLSEPSPETEAAIGERVAGYRIDFEVTGRFTPRPPPDSASPPVGSPESPEPN